MKVVNSEKKGFKDSRIQGVEWFSWYFFSNQKRQGVGKAKGSRIRGFGEAKGSRSQGFKGSSGSLGIFFLNMRREGAKESPTRERKETR